ncbi:hypothetical protein B7494_g1398 [Chlorociboria aeruginascens]|nr:hypothetical protein B7494_g1398 [Chlorociboria aeruginascens]
MEDIDALPGSLSRGHQSDEELIDPPNALPPPKKPGSKGLGKKRTKTGCLTCRRRRIKCGEEKPICQNCIKSKRQCEGYNQRVVFKDPLSLYRGPPLSTTSQLSFVEPNSGISMKQSQDISPSQSLPVPGIAPRPGGSSGLAATGAHTSLGTTAPISEQSFDAFSTSTNIHVQPPIPAPKRFDVEPERIDQSYLPETATRHFPTSQPYHYDFDALTNGPARSEVSAFAARRYSLEWPASSSVPPTFINTTIPQSASKWQTPVCASTSTFPPPKLRCRKCQSTCGSVAKTIHVSRRCTPAKVDPGVLQGGFHSPVKADDELQDVSEDEVDIGCSDGECQLQDEIQDHHLKTNDLGIVVAIHAQQDAQDLALRSFNSFISSPNMLATYVPSLKSSPLSDRINFLTSFRIIDSQHLPDRAFQWECSQITFRTLNRAREIQAQEGLPVTVWGPPTSGNSTPLRENIPESPTDGFPDFTHLPTPESMPSTRRARAGTVPSRFSPGGASNGLATLPSLVTKTTRPSPSPSPFKTPSPNLGDMGESTNAALLSRLRAGSLPQRSQYANPTGPFGPSVFSTNWASGRERTSTLASIASQPSNGPSSPAQSSFSREGTGDNDMQMRTLDYLGLADTPQPSRAQMANPFLANLTDLSKQQQASRYRSYSVNATGKYETEEDDDYANGNMTPYGSQQAHIQMQLAATTAAIQHHNLAVQAYANQASSNRPRARTAGVLDSPQTRLLRNYYPSVSRLDSSLNASDMRMSESQEYDALPDAVTAVSLGGRTNSRNDNHLNPDDNNLEGPTRALWLGSTPASTTESTLKELFKPHGQITSARVLTHKNCGFVNFERVESAVNARAAMNGKEIFPGAGPVRINFAKPASPSGTPGADGTFPSPSPDPFMNEKSANGDTNLATPGFISRPGTAPLLVPKLRDMKSDILEIVEQFSGPGSHGTPGAKEDDTANIAQSLTKAIQYDGFQSEIPAIQEPAHNRVHDAPKLRDIRKRIDNQSWSASDIENIAMEMLPEIAELASDYLGNTVVQKLFEHCSDEMRDAMLVEIAPHMAEIGVHKNGTWAAQKIIDVCKTPKQMGLIVSNLQPYTVPLFLDQYGNYVLQCCLKFGSPYNDFIFEAMLSQMWDISQGRYGSRAMRACLESHHSTKDQQRMLAAAIALHSVQLATNTNGALLLTWLLDTCTFPKRRTVLAPQLIPHLVHLCTHKVAYLTVLKVINQKSEPDARDSILQALFFSQNDKTLEAILSDHACGATLIFKVLTTPFFDESIRPQVVVNVRNVLQRLKAQPAQGYKRLMDEVGLSTRNASTGPSRDHANGQSTERQRPGSNHSNANSTMAQPPQFGNQFYPQISQGPFDMNVGMQRQDSIDSNISPFQAYGLQTPIFPGSNVSISPVNMQQLQYQQGLLARTAPLNNYYPGIPSGFGYSNPSPSADNYRNQGMTNGSPVQPSQQMSPGPMVGQNAFGPPGFGSVGIPGLGYGGYGAMSMPGMGYVQQEQVNGRRGRSFEVSSS